MGMNLGYGGYGSGYRGLTVLGPADAAGMRAMLDYIDGQTNHTVIQTKRLKGCEVREYTMSDGCGVGVVLPDYFITVEFYQTGNSNAADIQTGIKIAQRVDKLPEAKKQEIIKEQAKYDAYRLQAEEKTWDIADKVQRGENISVDDVLDMKADPASMRTLKNMQNVDGMKAELGVGGSRQVQTEFNNILDEKVYQPSYKDVKNHLSSKYKESEIRVETVCTPGREYHPWDVNTDNDIIALRKVNGPNGLEWVEIPRSEWEDTYFKSYAQNTGFNPRDAAQKFPNEDWAKMSPDEQYRKWGELHGESPTDVTHLEAARDFSDQRTWIIEDGDLPGRQMIEATPEEIARGVDTVTIDGKQMRPASAYELARGGKGDLLDSEQLGMMEKYKVNEYWNKGGTPQDRRHAGEYEKGD